MARGQRLDDIAESEKKIYSALRTYNTQSVSSNNFDVSYYRCEWSVDPAIRYISGKVTSYFTITVSSNNIVYDLYNDLAIDSIVYHGNKISFSRPGNNSVQINFPATINAGQKDSVSLIYHGVPPNIGFGSFNMTIHNGAPVLWTLSEPYGAATWWPCKDITTDKADSLDVVISYPSQYVSSSNGVTVKETISGNTKTTHWKHRYPIATYLIAIAVTNYTVTHDEVQLPSGTMPIAVYAYPENNADFQNGIAAAKFCLPGFSSLFIEYPFAKERFAETQFGWGGGMEHQTNIFIVNASSNLVAHELGHQWFGDRITCGSWQDLWLNEGFATYMEYIYTELSNPGGELAQLKGWTDIVTSFPVGSVFVDDTSNLTRLFDGRLTYKKGGYLLHMLRWKLGDSTFFRGLRRYLTDPLLAYHTARTADLQRNLETESGQDLTQFFQEWLYGQGYPNYDAQWNQQANNIVRVQLNQTTSDPSSVAFYHMPVPLQFKNASRDTTITVNHEYSGQIFTVNPGFSADTLIIDPKLWIVAKTKTSKQLPAPAAIGNVMIYPNPVRSQFSVSFPSTITNLNIQIFNAAGQMVFSKTPATNTSALDVPAQNWAAGIYWLRVSGNNFTETRKFFISNK